MSFTVDVNPAVLRWARESAGYGVPEVAKRSGISAKMLQAWESGKPRPSWPKLCTLAKLYKRPVTSLLLRAAPEEAPLPTDYRTLPDAKRQLSPKARFVIRTARWLVRTARQLERELGIDAAFEAPKVHLSDDPDQVAQKLRRRLGIAIAEQASWRNVWQALRQWRAAIEAQHVYVFQFRMPEKEVRGFSLFEERYPAIVLNEADAVSARIFTLFHEYAHLAMARPGVCIPEQGLVTESQQVETFCNRFAAALLIPRADLRQRLPEVPRDKAIGDLARRYRVSRYVVLGRMCTIGAISRRTYQEIARRWQSRQDTAPTTTTGRKGGQTRAARCLTERGRSFVSVVIEAAKREYIAANDATSYLGVRLEDLRKLASKVK